MKKLILFNFIFFLILFSFMYLILSFLNLIVSAPPRYHEIVYTFDDNKFRNKKEKLIFYKSKKNKTKSYLSNNFLNNTDLKFTGSLINRKCGSIESGIHELIYISDKYGFRENDDKLYNKTDYILLGDSFTESICVNQPDDLKSNLLKINNKKTYLNLGLQGTDYPQQLVILKSFTKNTNFKSLIWFFYEGNDYEGKLTDKSLINYKKNIEKIKYQPKEFYYKKLNKHSDKINITKSDYYLKNTFQISIIYKLRVYLAEKLNGLSFFAKYFKKYNDLLDYDDYNKTLNLAKKFLDDKQVKDRYIYYIPSWQRLSNYKSKRINLYRSNPQIKQLDKLKNSIKQISEKNNFTFIDGENYFLKLENPLEVFHYQLNTHFNKIGYNHLAKDVYNKINN